MHPTLRAYLRANYDRHPAASWPLKEMVSEFQQSLPEADRADWPRGRVVAELARGGIMVGIIDKVLHVAGYAPRRAEWREHNGRLELAHDVR